MLSLKLVRSLVLGETINNPLLTQNHHGHDLPDDEDDDHSHHILKRRTSTTIKSNCRNRGRSKTPMILFVPTKELITDTYSLATVARNIGMDLYPNPSLSHIIFSWPSSAPSPLSSSSLWSSSSSSWSFSADAVPLPFPSLSSASCSSLRHFVDLSKGLFKLAFVKIDCESHSKGYLNSGTSNWDCSELSLFSRLTGSRIQDMDGFSRVLAGKGWTLFKTKKNPLMDSVYLYRRLYSSRVPVRKQNGDAENCGEFRIRELKLPLLDFRNTPLRILQYILLMTDDVFYLA